MKTYNYVPYYYYYFDEVGAPTQVEAKPNSSDYKKWGDLDQETQTKIFDAAKPFLASGQALPDSMKIYAGDLKNEYNKAKQNGAIDEKAEKKEANSPEGKEQMEQAKKNPGFLSRLAKGIRNKIRGYDDDVQKLISNENLRELGLDSNSQQQNSSTSNSSSNNNNMMDWMNNPMMMMAMMGGGGGGFNPFMMQYMMQMMQNMQNNNSNSNSGPQRMTASEAASSIKSGMKAMKATGKNIQKVKDIVLKIQKKHGDAAAAEQAQAYGGYTLEQLGIKPSGK